VILCAGVVSAMLLVLWACVAVNAWHFGRRRPMPAGKVLPMTMIKPVKGLDDALVAGLESIVASDPERALELIVAIESEDDPAYPAARAFAARHQDRDVKVLITGPSRGRMGKAHNMIEAYRAAKHPRVIFSDADTEATDGLVRRTSEAFTQGYEAVFALPFHRRAPGPGGFLFQVAFNHGFGVGAALSWYLGAFRFAAGAWMAYTKEAIDRSGGLEPVAHAIADDFAISVRARAAGAREKLLDEYVYLQETGTRLWESLVHVAKWSAIIRWSVPFWAYAAAPLGSLLGWSLALLWSSGGSSFGWTFFGAATASRPLAALAQDAFAAKELMPLWQYPLLALGDVGAAAFWLSGFRSTIVWRGRKYRLLPGGQSKVIE